jgi:2-polyprenyl-3-methyl-5-hydroxy-6-metoxy-1,4-benzoquinol methylase
MQTDAPSRTSDNDHELGKQNLLSKPLGDRNHKLATRCDVTPQVISRYQRLYGLTDVTAQMISDHWQLETRLAEELLASPAESRQQLFESAYSELYHRCPWLNAHCETDAKDKNVAPKLYSYLNWLIPKPPSKILEIGSGGGTLISYLARQGHDCVGSDITDERQCAVSEQPATLTWRRASATDFVHAEDIGQFDVVISDQVVEHLHPDDVVTHLHAARSVLKKDGRYLLRCPHRMVGPHDVSQVFDNGEARGMHLKEYTYAELASQARQVGFRAVSAYFIWPRPLRLLSPMLRIPMSGSLLLKYYLAVERLASLLPRSLARPVFLGLTGTANVCLVLHA